MRLRLLTFALLFTPVLCAQAPGVLPAYDVVSIKPNKTGSGSVNIDSDTEKGYFNGENISIKELLEDAYDVRPDLISGIPGPVGSARFNLNAKMLEPDPVALKKLTREQSRSMLLPILVERFHLQAHIEVRTLPVYELYVLPGGTKCKESATQSTGNESVGVNNSRELTMTASPMATLAKSLTNQIHRTVLDKTGLTKNYDCTLKWTPDSVVDAPADAPPPMFTALSEELGLKLRPAKGPVPTLIVDHAELPSEN